MEEKNKKPELKENAAEIREWLKDNNLMTDAEKDTAS